MTDTFSPIVPNTKTNVLSIISLVTGILGIIACCLNLFIGFLIFPIICSGLLAPAGLVTGLISLNQIKKSDDKGRGMAVAGTVMGIVGTLLACLYGILMLLVVFGFFSLPFLPFLDPSLYSY